MDALELLLGRESALKVTEPAPNQAQLDIMLRAAARAPDHGRLRPWRFVIVPSDRRGGFGEVLAESLCRVTPDASEDLLQRERAKALHAPIIVVVAAHLQRDHRIPVIEQVSAAAAAAQNIMLAAHAQGYGAMWKTGAPAYDTGVKQALGLQPDDEIIGFIYIGTRADQPQAVPRPATGYHAFIWGDGRHR